MTCPCAPVPSQMGGWLGFEDMERMDDGEWADADFRAQAAQAQEADGDDPAHPSLLPPWKSHADWYRRHANDPLYPGARPGLTLRSWLHEQCMWKQRECLAGARVTVDRGSVMGSMLGGALLPIPTMNAWCLNMP